MKRVVYLSDAAGPMNAAHLSQILNASRRNNTKSELSGLLIFHNGRFFQTIEGPASNVIACLRRIAEDPRHTNVQVLCEDEVPDRAFPNWRMGFSKPQDLRAEQAHSVFSIYEMIPPNSEQRGDDPVVRRAVRDFLASFERLSEPT